MEEKKIKREYFPIPNDSAAKGCRLYRYTGKAVKERLKKKYIIQLVVQLVQLYIGRTTVIKKDSIQLTKTVYYYNNKTNWLHEGRKQYSYYNQSNNKNGCIT